MAELAVKKSVSIEQLMANLDFYKHNPSAIQQTVFEYLGEITAGDVNIVDPTSPFVFLLEASSVNTALAVNETAASLRRQYPSLAQTESELYHHLSDKDYLDRFASPASVTFTVAIQANDVLNKMQYSADEDCFKATIPRDSKFTIDQYDFILQYPIDIRKYSNGLVKITYDAEIVSPLETLTSNEITYEIRIDVNQVKWVFFDVKVKQLAISSVTFPVQKSVIFNQSIPHSDSFFYVRAFRRSTSDTWIEMHTTHSDQVFDPLKPTALVQVFEQYIKVNIPPVYLTSGLVSGEVRFDVYTTKGDITVNLVNYKPDAFSLIPLAIDEQRDLNEFTEAFSNISAYAFSKGTISGGSDGISFATLRDRVIFNATGENQLPITNKQIQTFVEDKGFDLVKNVDTVTNRIFLATQRLPKPSNPKLATSANIGISTFITNIDKLKTLDTVRYNNNRLTILSRNLFRNDNGIIKILTTSERNSLLSLGKSALVSTVNSTNFLYSPYHYVLDDTNQEFTVRAYSLDYPKASALSFVSQNQTLQLPVNTDTYSLSKTQTGYKLQVLTRSGNFYKQLADGLVSAQLAYLPVGETRMAYINGVLVGRDDNDERIYEFTIETNFDINDNNSICITNAKMFGNEEVDTWLDLQTKFNIFYATSSIVNGFQSDASDALLGKFILPANSSVVTHERVTLTLGHSLKNLWSRSRSMNAGLTYRTYSADVPAFYETDIYRTNPDTGIVFEVVNGEIVYDLLHKMGDPVLDGSGNQVYRHRKGDIELNSEGKPVVQTLPSIDKELDILFVDGRHSFVDDPAFLAYNDELVNVIDTWVTEDLADISSVLLEQSRIYFYPKTTLGTCMVFIEDGGQDFLTSEQSFVVNLYVKSDIYNDATIRAQLEATTVQELDSFIDDTVVNLETVETNLKASYSNSVQSFSIAGLGGDKNYRIVTIANSEKRLALKKALYQQQDGSLIIKEDVTVNFFKVV